MRGLHCIAALAVMAAFVTPASADYIVLNVSCGGCTVVNSAATGINNNGEVVGYFTDPSGHSNGFVYQGGVYTEITVPFSGVTDTSVTGVNDSGEIIGYYSDASGQHGFTDITGTFTTVDRPLNTGTMLAGINNSDEIVGYDSAGNFVYNGGSFTVLPDDPGYTYPNTYFQGIDDGGLLIGNYSVPSWVGFTYDGTNFTSVPYPDYGYIYGDLNGISGNGVAVGAYYLDSSGITHPYAYDTFTKIETLIPDYAGGWGTSILAIDNAGYMAGYFTLNQAGTSYQALEEVPEPCGLSLMAGGALALLLRRRGVK